MQIERIMNRFMVSQYIKTMDYGFNPQELFYTKEDNFKTKRRIKLLMNKFYVSGTLCNDVEIKKTKKVSFLPEDLITLILK